MHTPSPEHTAGWGMRQTAGGANCRLLRILAVPPVASPLGNTAEPPVSTSNSPKAARNTSEVWTRGRPPELDPAFFSPIPRQFGYQGPPHRPYPGDMRTTRYFREQVLRKRPYLEEAWILATIEAPEAVRVQPDDRIQYWRYIPALRRHLRLVTLADGVTVHNAFPDRGFRGSQR